MRSLSLILSAGLFCTLSLAGCGGSVVLDNSTGGGAGADPGTGGSTPTTSPLCQGAEKPLGAKSSLAILDPGSSWRVVWLSLDHVASCAQPEGYPPDCSGATAVNLILAPDATAGTYPMDGTSSLVFGNVDVQYGGPDGCGMMAGPLTGTVVLTAVDKAHVAGAICDSVYSGTFDASTCTSCLDTGVDCVSDDQCCNNFCDPTYHLCQP